MRREQQRVRREVMEALVEVEVEIPPPFFMPQVPVVEDPREDPAWLREWREMMEADILYYQYLDTVEDEDWDRDQLAYDPVDCSWQHDWD